MTILQEKYKKEALPKLKEEFGFTNDLAAPIIEKIVLNMGLAEAASSKEVLEKATDQLGTIAGQKPKVTRAKKAISSFKLRQDDQIGLMVTLRKKKAWNFLEKFINIVMPRMRDFRGLSQTNFDKDGNFSLGISEQILFPEIDYSKIDKIRGLVITLRIKNSNQEKSKKLLELLGVPFKKNE
jgi:large subunit ribosomal protein L5